MSSLTVLTPNGRRQNVKVQPNTTILQVERHIHTTYTNGAYHSQMKYHIY